MNNVLAMIFAGGQGDRLRSFPNSGSRRLCSGASTGSWTSRFRTARTAASPRFRCSRSTGPRSLVNHIGAGRPWGFDTLDGGIQMLQPYLGRADSDWYQGTADAVYQNLYVIEESRAREVLILAGDHIFT